MQQFAPQENRPERQQAPKPLPLGTGSRVPSRRQNSNLILRRALQDQSVPKPLQLRSEHSSEVSADQENFSRVSTSSLPAIRLQTKLTVNQPGDAHEQEANRVADHVMRMRDHGPDPGPTVSLGGAGLQRECACGGKCDRCKKEKAAKEAMRTQHGGTRVSPALSLRAAGVQRVCSCGGTCAECKADKASEELMRVHDTGAAAGPAVLLGNAGGMEAPPIVHEVLRSPGQPLDKATREFMEPRFGHGFGHVRVHTDAKAAESAKAVEAKAYTVGRNLVFAAGQYGPATREGKRLIAHELTHTLQQGYGHGRNAGGMPAPMVQREKDDPRPLRLEEEISSHRFHRSQWLDTQGGTHTEELYWAKFDVDEHGVMTGSVKTVSSNRVYRSGALRFEAEFRRALDYFRNKGVEIRSFEGDWSYMTPDEISDNLHVFKEGMAQGLTREAAAAKTPTGKVVTRAGFRITHVENDPTPQEHLGGARRLRVKAVFTYEGTMAPPAPHGPAPGTGGAPPPGTPPKAPSTPFTAASASEAENTRPGGTGSNIDLSEYPPDRQGPITGAFKDGTAIRNAMTAINAARTAISLYTQKDISALGWVEHHFSSEIDDAWKDLQLRYPVTDALLRAEHLDELGKSYEQAISELNAPRNALILAEAGVIAIPEKDREAYLKMVHENFAKLGGGQGRWQNYLHAADAYMQGIFRLQEDLGEAPWELPKIIPDIDKRAAVLADAGAMMERTFWSLMASGAATVPVVYYESFDFLHVAGVLKGLSGRLYALSNQIQLRANSYQALWDRLEQELKHISTKSQKLSDLYHLKLPRQ